jgi:hypothetical protein
MTKIGSTTVRVNGGLKVIFWQNKLVCFSLANFNSVPLLANKAGNFTSGADEVL